MQLSPISCTRTLKTCTVQRTAKEKQAKAVVDSLKQVHLNASRHAATSYWHGKNGQLTPHPCVAQATELLSSFPSFGAYRKNGCNLGIKFQQAHELAPANLTWAYDLCEQNMRSMYEEVWGWKPAEKQKELKHPDARYLLVHDAHASTVAYVHFRYACSLLLPFKAEQVSCEAAQEVMHMLMARQLCVC